MTKEEGKRKRKEKMNYKTGKKYYLQSGTMSKSWIFLSNVSELLIYAIVKLNIKKIIREECHDYSIQVKHKKKANQIKRSLAA